MKPLLVFATVLLLASQAPVVAKVHIPDPFVTGPDGEIMKEPVGPIEAPADFATNCWHFAHGLGHFLGFILIFGSFCQSVLWLMDRIDAKSTTVVNRWQ